MIARSPKSGYLPLVADEEESLRSDQELRPSGCAKTAELPIAQSLGRSDASVHADLDTALIEIAEEIKLDWPEFLPVERIKAGMREAALGFLVLVGLVALGGLFLLSPTLLR